MPHISERQQLLSDLEKCIAICSFLGDDKEAMELYYWYCRAASSRFINDREIRHRPAHYFNELFPTLSTDEFRSMFRTTRQGFNAALEKIQDHPVFTNNSTCDQVHPARQLAVALARFGSNGNGASVAKMQEIFGIGTGTVTLYTKRVITALWSIKGEWITWPNAERREENGRIMRGEGFPGCVGFIDGTTIPLSQKPALDGEVYFDRKKRYSVAMQIVCDVDKRIIALHLGYPGSCADSMVYRQMDIYKASHKYFSPGEYLLADSAYGLSKTCIPAYKAPAASKPDNAEFNYCVARSHARNEHCIGILKSRWASIQEMRQQLRSADDMKMFIDWIVACCVLYNMLARLGDAWEKMYIEEEDDNQNTALYDEERSSRGAESFREVLRKTTLETNYANSVLPLR